MKFTLKLCSTASIKRPFYITTPIFYVNAAPHLGHLYTALVADAIQRFEKLKHQDYNIIFSTGTDEHGTKIQQAAAKSSVPLQKYCDEISAQYSSLFKEFGVEYTDFIRTTEFKHKKAVAHFWNKLVQRDYIYKAQYRGWYSVNDETFVPENHLKEETKDGKRVVKVSAESGHEVEWTEETNYMFRMSAFKTHLQDWLKTDGVIIPNKFQKLLRDSLANESYFPDISVSRPSSRVHWAIRVPGDKDQSIYVWLDALVNYLTVIGYPDEDKINSLGRPWPADVQVIGKDIIKFHGIYWPALLMACGLHPPRRLVCHSHWTVDGAKMSKSLGNVVDPLTMRVSAEAARYLLLREGTLHSDANYSEKKLVNVCNAELADTLGNLVSRCCGRAINIQASFPALPEAWRQFAQEEHASNLMDCVAVLAEKCNMHYNTYQFYKVADDVMQALRLANVFFENGKPWELKKFPEKRDDLDFILHVTLETLRISAIILQPLIPEMSRKLLDKLKVPATSRSWQDSETPSWKSDAITKAKAIESDKLILFQRVLLEKNNDGKKEASLKA